MQQKGAAAQKKRQHKPARTQDNVDAFFATFPAFHYRPSAPIVAEFHRMCDFFGWRRDDARRKAAHTRFKDAMVLDFNSFYGTDVNALQSWQLLCRAVNVVPLPEDIAACREASTYTEGEALRAVRFGG